MTGDPDPDKPARKPRSKAVAKATPSPAPTQAPAPAPPPPGEAARFIYGPRPLGALVPSVTRAAFRKRAPATASLLADWPSVVGPALAAVTVPRRLSAGSLTIACAGPVALELQHLAEQLINRINSHAGHAMVARLKFVQDLAPRQTLPAPPPPPAGLDQALAQSLTNVPPGPLRDALERLGRAVLTERGLAPTRPDDQR